mgnify:CR=1 FL=1
MGNNSNGNTSADCSENVNENQNPGKGNNNSLSGNSMKNVYHHETVYLYEGLTNNLHKEYSEAGSPYAEYYKGPDNQTVSRKMLVFMVYPILPMIQI